MEKKALNLLVLEDNPDDVELAVKELEQEGFDVEWSMVETEETFRKAIAQGPDLILADYSLPCFDGMSALMIQQYIAPEIPLIVVSGTIGEDLAVECMRSGATDYVLKDNLHRLGPVVKRALEEAEAYRGGKLAKEELRESFEKLQRTFDGTIHALASVVEMRDSYTAGHQQRVATLACAIAQEMGLSEETISGIYMAAIIHDIGKISVPVEILSKPSRLSEVEFNMIKAHSKIGYEILKGIEFARPIAQIVLQHHERMNGSGYPQGLKGNNILLEARIIGVADVVEAISSHRPYRPALGIDKALEEISKNRSVLYEPEIVDACLELFAEKGFRFEG